MGQKRNRRTRQEMLDHYLAEAARVQAQIDGSYTDENENNVLKALKRRLKAVNKELRSARITLDGVAGSEGKGWSRSPIDEKIASTEKRLASQIETRDRSNVFATKLPFDVTRLEALIGAAEAGEDVEFPDDLTPLANEQERTDEQHEAAMIATDEQTEQEA